MALKKSSGVKAAVGLVLFCVVAVAMVIAARQPQPVDVGLDVVAVEAQPEDVTAAVVEPTATKPPAARAEAKKPAAAKAPAAVAVAEPDRTPAAEAVATESAAPVARAAEVTARVTVQESPDSTIEGCLERDNNTFRLKDTSGEDAPKARSWKSGFLKKGAARIEVIDTANRLNLPNHVGERITVTGMLVDREMHAHSAEFGAGSCK